MKVQLESIKQRKFEHGLNWSNDTLNDDNQSVQWFSAYHYVVFLTHIKVWVNSGIEGEHRKCDKLCTHQLQTIKQR